MEETKKKLSKKTIIGIAIGAVCIIAGLVIFLTHRKPKEEYRVIKVYEVDGDTVVKRGSKGDINAYQNMVLQSGDTVVVQKGKVTLKLDDDKYVYAEEGTEFDLTSSGNKKDNKTSIYLKTGAITNEIQNKLSDASSYEVNTQNSSMMVRGTVFRVEIETDKTGKFTTKLSGFQGKVELKSANLTDTKVISVVAGEEVKVNLVDDKITIGEVKEIDYSELPQDTLKMIYDILTESTDKDVSEKDIITKDDIGAFLNKVKPIEKETTDDEQVYIVEFYYEEKLFGTQEVKKGELVKEPTLVPDKEGDWDFDFDTVIKKDTKINWKK